MDATVREPSPYTRYFIIWIISWTLITLLTQMPDIWQFASNLAAGGWSLPFNSVLIDFIIMHFCIAIVWALLAALVSLLLQYSLMSLTKRYSLPAESGFRIIIESGVALGCLETLVLGLPLAILLYLFLTMGIAGDERPNTFSDQLSLFIEIGGVAVSYFAACVIAAFFAWRGASLIYRNGSRRPWATIITWTTCILSAIFLVAISVFYLLTDWPNYAAFISYICLTLSIHLTSTFWSSKLKTFRLDITFAHIVSVIIAWNICFADFNSKLWRGFSHSQDYPGPLQPEMMRGSISGFMAVVILFLVTSALLFIWIRLRIRRQRVDIIGDSDDLVSERSAED